MIKQKVYLLLGDLDQLRNDTFCLYLFKLIVILKLYFICSNSFPLSWAGKVTAGTKRLVSVTEAATSIAKSNFTINKKHFKSSPKIT